jgi:hypothetical protein
MRTPCLLPLHDPKDCVHIEFFDLARNADYDAKMKLKQELCRKHDTALISIYPQNLASSRKLEGELLAQLHT